MNKNMLINELQEQFDKLHSDIYLTATFRAKAVTESAEKKFKFFFKCYLNKNKIFFEKYILCWVFFEKGDIRKGIHIHALIKNINPRFTPLLQVICEHFFGESKVVAYDHNRPKERQASYYLARKYCSEKLDHFDFYKINSRRRG